jgi:5-formyltetrahydrofolate cyclo-ligase
VADGLEDAKRSLRSEATALRRALPAEARERAAAAIAEHVRSLSEYARAPRVAAYAALPDEVPCDALVREVLASGRVLLLPRLAGEVLQFVAVSDLAALRAGRFGVAEPSATDRGEPLAADDLVLVPGVAFDARGGRLGRGSGFYDRSLPRGAGAPVVFGVAFACQLVEAVPMAPHDRRVDGVVTERGVLR